MESSRKRRGFLKGKLTPFYRSAKPSTTTTAATSVQYSSTVKSSASQTSPSTASVGFVVHHQQQQQDYMIALPRQKVSFVVPDSNGTAGRDKLSLSKLEKLYGVAGDESVDVKAASFIFSVQERFKLERTHSERIMQHEDMQQT